MQNVVSTLCVAWTTESTAALEFLGQALVPLTSTFAAATASPLAAATSLAVLVSAACWVGNVASGYWSWVDRCWSTIPIAYAFIYAVWSGSNARNSLMFFLVAVWGARLTYNFARKGGYTHLEDYRWPVLRKWFQDNDKFHPAGQEVFNLFFVCIYQMIIIAAFVVPPMHLVRSAGSNVALGIYDLALAAVFVGLVYLEWLTDEAQWKFQSAKAGLSDAERAKKGGDVALGFCTSGPFRYSRHLNFFCEMSIWWVFYAFTVVSGSPLVNWSVFGTLFLTMLFQGSTWMTEKLSAAKYPAYSAYQQTTSRLMPWFPAAKTAAAAAPVATKAAAAPASAAPTPKASKGRRGSRADL